MQTEIISAREAKDLLPLIDERHFVGAMWDPIEGHLDPYGTTHAYANRRGCRAPKSTSIIA
jgi:dimethylglycine dehydrogenase